MADLGGAGGGTAALVGIYAAVVYDIISATNSSPQTTEINAASRGPTLMKWVNLGLLQAAGFVALGALLARPRWAPLLGGGIAMALLWLQYRHAHASGLRSPGASTESTFGTMP